jgi:hypothetical protein
VEKTEEASGKKVWAFQFGEAERNDNVNVTFSFGSQFRGSRWVIAA